MRGGDADQAPSPPPGNRTAPTLVVLALAQFTTTLEFSIVYVALPAIDADLRMGTALLQWVPSAYTVFLASLLVLSGRLADRYGPDRLFRWAVFLFAAASAVAALAPGSATLLAARAAQGAAAAMVQPAVLGLLQRTFPGPAARARAFAVWSSAGALGLAVGTVVGGLLTVVSWRLTFAINVPLLLPCLIGALLWLRAPRPATPPSALPVTAALLGTLAVAGPVTALTLAAEHGWSAPATRTASVVAAVLLAVFLLAEARAPQVLVDRTLRRVPGLRLGAAVTASYMGSLGSTYYLLTLLLQDVRGLSPLAAGAAFLPLTGMVALGGPVAGLLLRRVGPRPSACAGFAVGAAGLLALAALADAPYPVLLPALLVCGLGNGVVFTTMFVLGTADVPDGLQGSAGGLLTSSQYVGNAVALALLTLVIETGVDAGRIGLALVLTAGVAVLGMLLTALPRAAGPR